MDIFVYLSPHSMQKFCSGLTCNNVFFFKWNIARELKYVWQYECIYIFSIALKTKINFVTCLLIISGRCNVREIGMSLLAVLACV